MKKLIGSVSAIAIISAGGPLHAADQPQPGADDSNTTTNDTLTEVIVTGTRQTGVRASDSAAPISIVDAASMSRVGQPGSRTLRGSPGRVRPTATALAELRACIALVRASSNRRGCL